MAPFTSEFPRNPLKDLFLLKNRWYHHCKAKGDTIRDTVIENVTKMLACGYAVMGGKEYHCNNSNCPHSKYIYFTCKSRFCSSCGAKQTNQWMATQNAILPDCDWVHIVFTMPYELSVLLFHNRELLTHISGCGASVLQETAKTKMLSIGVFSALHSFGRSLNKHIHSHISTTAGGLNAHGVWKKITFKKAQLTMQWKKNLAAMFRAHYSELTIPDELMPLFGSYAQLDRWFTGQCDPRIYWHVYVDKKTSGKGHTVGYLGRYLKRPAISASRLKHYSADGNIQFRYLDHRSKQHVTESVSPEMMIELLTLHIHEKHFRTIRYYGFLSNRNRSSMLPKVYEALAYASVAIPKVSYAGMLKRFTKIDPFKCILCKGKMVFRSLSRGLRVKELISHWESFAQSRPVGSWR